jgi:hypothetical protein
MECPRRNVLLGEGGAAKLGDFGLARPRGDESISEEGLIVNTYAVLMAATKLRWRTSGRVGGTPGPIRSACGLLRRTGPFTTHSDRGVGILPVGRCGACA